MQKFVYRARDRQGNDVEGTIHAESLLQLIGQLKEQELSLVEHHIATQNGNGNGNGKSHLLLPARKRLHLGLRYLIPFTYYLRSLHVAGVPLDKSLRDLEQYPPHPRCQKIARGLRLSIEEGNSLAQSLARYPRTFSPVYVATVEMGEASGRMDAALERLTVYLERIYETRNRIFQELLYPAILVVAILIVLVLIAAFLLPVLYDVYATVGTALPGPTFVIWTVGLWLRQYWALLILVSLLALCFLFVSRHIFLFRYAEDALLLKLPFFKDILRKNTASHVSHTLSTLHQAGVDMSTAMSHCTKTVGNLYLRQQMAISKRWIDSGKPLSLSLQKTAAFPPLAISMVKAGEQAAQLEASLDKVCELYDREIPAAMRNFFTAFQTIFITLALGFVAYIFFYSILPIYSLLRILH